VRAPPPPPPLWEGLGRGEGDKMVTESVSADSVVEDVALVVVRRESLLVRRCREHLQQTTRYSIGLDSRPVLAEENVQIGLVAHASRCSNGHAFRPLLFIAVSTPQRIHLWPQSNELGG
jgi:hypothetical protein